MGKKYDPSSWVNFKKLLMALLNRKWLNLSAKFHVQGPKKQAGFLSMNMWQWIQNGILYSRLYSDWNRDYFSKSGEGSTHGFWCLYNDDTIRKLTFLTAPKEIPN